MPVTVTEFMFAKIMEEASFTSGPSSLNSDCDSALSPSDSVSPYSTTLCDSTSVSHTIVAELSVIERMYGPFNISALKDSPDFLAQSAMNISTATVAIKPLILMVSSFLFILPEAHFRDNKNVIKKNKQNAIISLQLITCCFIIFSMAVILNGKILAEEIREGLKKEVEQLRSRGIKPCISVLLIGDNPASQIYVKNKKRAAEEVGIVSFIYNLEKDVQEEKVVNLLNELNIDSTVHGILIQLPLPPHLNEEKLISIIDPKKDVDGFHPENMGLLLKGLPRFEPCTPLGIIRLIEHYNIKIEGKDAVVVGRSNIVGKPLAIMLLKRNATITICHTRTLGLPDKIKRADILVVAVGKPQAIKGEWIKDGATVIDVGINRLPDGRLTGDVDFESAEKRAEYITPVPGGVGPMTIAMLLSNTVYAAKMLNGLAR